MVSKRKTLKRVLQSILYHSSFWFLVLVAAVTVGGSAWGLLTQAWRSKGQRRINVVILVGGYASLVFFSLFIALARFLGNRAAMREIPHGYIPTKEEDLPKELARYITAEYTRTAIIGHLQQQTAGSQPGWGSPNGEFPNIHFRTYILETLPLMKAYLLPDPSLVSAAPPNPNMVRWDPLFRHPVWRDHPDGLQVIAERLEDYAVLLEDARFGEGELSEDGFSIACWKIIAPLKLYLVNKHLEVYPSAGGPDPQEALSEYSLSPASPLRRRISPPLVLQVENPFGSATTVQSEGSSRLGLMAAAGDIWRGSGSGADSG